MIQVKITLTAVLLAVLLAVPGPSFARQDKNIRMTFEVVGDALELKGGRPYTTPSNCRRDDHPGCYDIGGEEVGKFTLTLHRGNADCEDPDEWKFHSVVLGGESDVENPGPKPSSWGGISSGAAQDFDADAGTGEVNLVPDGKKRVTFEDQNNHSLSIWYKVTVESCGDGGILEYDPRVDNKGLPSS